LGGEKINSFIKILRHVFRTLRIDSVNGRYVSCSCILLICVAKAAAVSNTTQNWPHSAGDSAALRYTKALQINSENVNNLQKSFQFDFRVLEGDTVQATPIQLENKLIFVDNKNNLIAINATSGRLEWQTSLPPPVGRRGISGDAGFIYVPTGDGLYQLILTTGKIKRKFGTSVSLVAPVVDGDTAFVASITGEIFSYDLVTGNQKWKSILKKDCGSARIWSGFSYSATQKKLIVTTANAEGTWSDDSNNCLANSVIGIDAKTGAVDWTFQELRADRWDLDMVSYPIVVKEKIGIENTKIAALSKTGNVFLLDAQNGNFLNEKIQPSSQEHREAKLKSGDPAFKLSDIKSTNKKNLDYIYWKIRNFKEFDYRAAAPGQPAFLKGLHGGFEWPGGALFEKEGVLVVPSNSFPWIIRNEVEIVPEKSIEDKVLARKNLSRQCISCHSASLSRVVTTEIDFERAGLYIPTLLSDHSSASVAWTELAEFRKAHQHAADEASLLFTAKRRYSNDMSVFWRVVRRVDRAISLEKLSKVIISFYAELNPIDEDYFLKQLQAVDQSSLDAAKREYQSLLAELKDAPTIRQSFWQPLNDIDGFPITSSPWGYLNAFDLSKNKILWRIPLGTESLPSGEKVEGARNFSGVLATGAGLAVVSGTPDKKARFIDVKLGKELLALDLPAAGTAPPMSYVAGGCQYIVFTVSGGKFTFFNDKGSKGAVIAYKLSSCEPSL
jgi:quinoprotein glucose dehydrogenase